MKNSILLTSIFFLSAIFGFTQTNSEVLYVKGQLSETEYTIQLPFDSTTTRYEISSYDHDLQDFELSHLLLPETDKELELVTYPASLLQVDGNPLIIEVMRESTLPNPDDPDIPNNIQEYTYLFPTNGTKPKLDNGYILILVDYTILPHLDVLLREEYKPLLEVDGYRVIIRKAPRAESFDAKAVATTKSIIKQVYEQTNGELTNVMLLGRIPLPYSGNYTVDGHQPDHLGAWPADTYYGDMDGEWDDFVENVEVSAWERMHNTPGDGKFDFEYVPGKIELSIGRVDFFDMGKFPATEVELYSRYLNKAIEYRLGEWDQVSGIEPAPLNAIFQDDWNRYGLGFPGYTVNSYLETMVKPENMHFGEIREKPRTSSYDFAYGGASGGSQSLHLVAYTDEYAENSYKNRFSQFFGSFVADIDFDNQIMRAVIASQGQTLTCNFGGRPTWIIQEMANGATIGESYLRTVNNKDRTFNGNGMSFSGGIHVLLLGDPTLRAGVFAAPQQAFPTSNGPSPDYAIDDYYNSEAYYLYRKNSEGEYRLDSIYSDKYYVESLEDQKDIAVRGLVKIKNNFGNHYRLSAPLFLSPWSSVEVGGSDEIEIAGNTLKLNHSLNLTQARLQVISTDGRILYSNDFSRYEFNNGIDLARIVKGSGSYLITIQSNDLNLHTLIQVVK